MSQPIQELSYSNNTYLLEADSSVFGVDHQFELEIVTTDNEAEEHEIELRGFFAVDLTYVITFQDSEDTNGNIDPVKVILWILDKVEKAVCPTCP